MLDSLNENMEQDEVSTYPDWNDCPVYKVTANINNLGYRDPWEAIVVYVIILFHNINIMTTMIGI